MDATPGPSTAPESSPTLSTLIPQPSIRRNLILASATLLLLVGAWTSPQVLRPSDVSGHSGGGGSTSLARQRQVLTTVQLTPDGWPNMGLQSVDDVTGARVAGAWVLPERLAQSQVETNPADYASGLDYLRASFPHNDFGVTSRLPHRLELGESAQLLILWDIADCTVLARGKPPRAELVSILGIHTREQLPDWASPRFALDSETENGICPAP
jgi:hypothetical protein